MDFKSISLGLAVHAGQAIRAGWATSAYAGKPFQKFINAEGVASAPHPKRWRTPRRFAPFRRRRFTRQFMVETLGVRTSIVGQ
jgi:hypothetical protein